MDHVDNDSSKVTSKGEAQQKSSKGSENPLYAAVENAVAAHQEVQVLTDTREHAAYLKGEIEKMFGQGVVGELPQQLSEKHALTAILVGIFSERMLCLS